MNYQLFIDHKNISFIKDSLYYKDHFVKIIDDFYNFLYEYIMEKLVIDDMERFEWSMEKVDEILFDKILEICEKYIKTYQTKSNLEQQDILFLNNYFTDKSMIYLMNSYEKIYCQYLN